MQLNNCSFRKYATIICVLICQILAFSSSQKNSDMDSDSDSDISVGTEFPLLYDEAKNVSSTSYSTSESSMDSIVKLRPGPRCFKLRQLFEAEKLLEIEKFIDG